jgi:hypothetical protein
MILPRVTTFAGFLAEGTFPDLLVTDHALIVKGLHACRQRSTFCFEVTGITRWLLLTRLPGEHTVAITAAAHLLVVHILVAAGAFGVHSLAQARSVSVGHLAVTLITRPWLRLDFRTVMQSVQLEAYCSA